MSDTTLASAAERRKLVRAGLGRRHLTERLFRGFGILAIVLALGFVGILFTDVLRKGIPAFMQSNVHLAVTYDPELLKIDPAPEQAAGQSDADFRAARLGWERKVAMLNWNNVIEAALRKAAPEGFEIDSRQILTITETDARHRVRERFVADPSLLGQTVEIDLLASANTDNWVKGNIDRDLGDAQQQLSAPARALIDIFEENGTISQGFAWSLFTNVDSRSAPASAGLLGALMGTFWMMLIVMAAVFAAAATLILETIDRDKR